MFTSRVVVFALALTLFRVWFVPFFVVHAVGFSIWVYNIAVESHNEATDTQVTDNPETRPVQKNRFHLAILVFLFFGLPSLVLWPIMFQLKEKKRPLVFLFVNTVENAVLLVVWYFCKSTNSPMDMYSLLVVVIGTLVADLFLSGYILCKPKLTDQVVLHDMRYQDTESFGIYYEFCDIVFRLKVRRQFTEELEEVRKSLGTSTHNGWKFPLFSCTNDDNCDTHKTWRSFRSMTCHFFNTPSTKVHHRRAALKQFWCHFVHLNFLLPVKASSTVKISCLLS